jgi:hypothetical protein
MKNPHRVPIRSARGYFCTVETLDRLYKARRQQWAKARADGIAALAGIYTVDELASNTDDPQEEILIGKLEKRIFAYLDSLSDEKRDQLKKSSRRYAHRELFSEYEDHKNREYWEKEWAGGEARLRRQKERGRVVAQAWSTRLMLDCMPTTDRASDLAARQQVADRFLSWAAAPAEDAGAEAERITAFVEAVWQAQSGYRHIVGLDAHRTAFQQLRQRHFFPDLIELIGEPQPQHHHSNGTLRTARKRQLLLIGIFPWRGMLLVYERFWSPDGWSVKNGFQWRVATSCGFPRTRDFPTLADTLPQPLTYKWGDFLEVCRAWHIQKETKASKGMPRAKRRVQCEHCLNWVFSDISKRLSLGGIQRRYCLSCYQTLSMARTLKELTREIKPSVSLRGRKKFWE